MLVLLNALSLVLAQEAPAQDTLPGCAQEVLARFERDEFSRSASDGEQCWARSRHPRMLYFAAQAHHRAGQHAAALYDYLEYLRIGTDAQQYLEDARAQVRALRSETTAVVFSISPKFEDSDEEPTLVLEGLDGPGYSFSAELRHCEGSEGARTMRLERGLWRVRALRPGFIPRERWVRIASLGETVEVAVELDREPAPPPPPIAEPEGPRPIQQRRLDLRAEAASLRPVIVRAEAWSLGALGLSLAAAGIGVAGAAAAQEPVQLPNGETVDRKLQFHSLGLGLLGAAVGAGVGAVTRARAQGPRAAAIESGIGAAATIAGWTLFVVTSAQMRERTDPDPKWYDEGRVAGAALAGVGMGLLVSSITYLVTDKILERRTNRPRNRNTLANRPAW